MRLLLLLPLATTACSEDIGPRPLTYELGTCGVVDIHPEDSAPHLAQGAVVEWSTNPPSSGPHYPLWAAWDRTYPSIARGNWLHNAEHGAIVFAYRCDVDCPEVVAQLEDAVRALPTDSTCTPPIKHRSLVVADPLMPEGTTVAAIAWGVTYTASCADGAALATFAKDFYARAPEDTCANGASLGGIPIE